MFHRLSQWISIKLVQPAKTLSPRDIGLSAAIGFYGGLFPVPAVSTGVTLAMCYGPLKSRYNPAMLSITLVFNALATPFQIICLPIFMNIPYNFANSELCKKKIKEYSLILPDWISQLPESIPSCNVSEFLESVKVSPVSEIVVKFGSSMLWAAFAWVSLAPISIVSSNLMVQGIVTFVKNRSKIAKL